MTRRWPVSTQKLKSAYVPMMSRSSGWTPSLVSIVGALRSFLRKLAGICLRSPMLRISPRWSESAQATTRVAANGRAGRIRKGNRYAKAILVQAAQAAARTKNTYLSAQYQRIAARRGEKRAVVAVGHSILVIYYHLLKTGQSYQEKGGGSFSELDCQHAERRLTKQLERLG
jgi:hypothetical protein